MIHRSAGVGATKTTQDAPGTIFREGRYSGIPLFVTSELARQVRA
jgi:hypothetical protein